MYGCESWTLKKAECRRIDAFELWCWRRLLSVPWTARRSNQSILEEINPDFSLEGLMLKLKLQYFDQLTHWKKPWCWERLKAGGEGDDRGWDGWMASPTQWTWVWASSRSWWRTGKPGMLQLMRSQRVRHDWTELKRGYIDVKWAHKKMFTLALYTPIRMAKIKKKSDNAECWWRYREVGWCTHSWWGCYMVQPF